MSYVTVLRVLRRPPPSVLSLLNPPLVVWAVCLAFLYVEWFACGLVRIVRLEVRRCESPWGPLLWVFGVIAVFGVLGVLGLGVHEGEARREQKAKRAKDLLP